MQCEMCGADSETLKANVEGTIMNVCRNCSKYGKVISINKPPVSYKKSKTNSREPVKNDNEEKIEMVIKNFAEKIKNVRENMKLDQEKFAEKINEKKSIIHKIETAEMKPSIELAKKLEKILNIKLIETYSEKGTGVETQKSSSGPMTIGDLINIKKDK